MFSFLIILKFKETEVLISVFCTLYTVHCTLYIIHVHCTLYIVHCTQYTVQCTMYTALSTLYMYHVYCTLYTVQCAGPYAPYYLGGFCCSTVLALSVMGGVFSVLPAYEADLFGSKYIGAIHGRFLTFGAVATVVGPTLLLNLRRIAETQAITGSDLHKVGSVSENIFFRVKFGIV